MAMGNLSSDWKKIGQSGATVDGRMIGAESLRQMAKNYDPATFTALLWADHQRWDWYNNKAAPNYGKVTKLKTVDNADGGVDLFAIINPNENYIYENRNGQLLFFSMEITADFAKKGYAYLTGLGITDDPASLGTSEMRFSSQAQKAGMSFADYTASTSKQFIEETSQNDGFYQLFKHFFSKQTQEIEMTPEELKAAIKEVNKDLITGLAEQFSKQAGAYNPKPEEPAKPEEKPMTKAELFKLIADVKAGKTDDDDKPLKASEVKSLLVEAFKSKSDESAADDKEKFSQADKNDLEKQIKSQQAALEALQAKFKAATKEQPGTDGGADDGTTNTVDDYI